MNESLQQYVQQTRQEIDTEKQQRDSLLNFAIAVMGAMGFGLIQSENFSALLAHPAASGIAVAILIVLTSLFWVRRMKLQQIADRWFVLYHLARKHPDHFPSPSLESLVCPNLTRWTYTIKDAVLSVALSTPIYALVWFSVRGVSAHDLIIPVHALLSFGLLVRGLKDKTRGQKCPISDSDKTAVDGAPTGAPEG